MMKIIKGASLPLLLSSLCVTTVLAQGTYTAASCNRTDVNAVINGPTHKAVDGDIIIIPAGTCTWTSGVTVSGVGIDITGQGTPNAGAGTTGAGTSTTTIVDNSSSALFSFTRLVYGKLAEVELLNVNPMISSTDSPFQFIGTCTSSGCAQIRVDNLSFPDGWVGKLPSSALAITEDVFGVFDHNSILESSGGVVLTMINYPAWKGVGSYGDNGFSSADSMGTNQNIFIENNYFRYTGAMQNDVGATGGTGIGSSRVVCRYNTFVEEGSICASHGTSWLGRERGTRQTEAYRNTVSNSIVGDAVEGINGGSGLMFENTVTGYFNEFLSLDVPRTWHSISPWNYCDGSQPWDTNDGTTYDSGTISTGGTGTFSDSGKSWTTNQWAGSAITKGMPYSAHDVTQNVGMNIASNTSNRVTLSNDEGYVTWHIGDSYQILRATVCMDQPGRSGGTYYSGSSPSPTSAANQTLDPIYEWGDTQTSGGASTVISRSALLIANRDFYAETHNQAAQTSPTSPFNGTSGDGHGTLANRPINCTAGVGYWATDQGSWNQSAGEQGELFVCTATNTWTLYYTPYTYPHPLTQQGDPPAPPTKLQALSN